MAKLTKSDARSALVDAEPEFNFVSRGFVIALTKRDDPGLVYRLHLTPDEAERFATFVRDPQP